MSFSIQFVIENPELQPWLWCFISPFIKSNPVKRRNKIRSCGALKSNHLNSPSSKCWLCLLVNCESCPPTEGWSYSLLSFLLLNLRGRNYLLGFHHVDTLVWDHDTCTDLKLVLVAQWESADSTFGRVMQVHVHGRLYQFCQIWIIWLSLMSERMPVHFSNSLLLWYWYNSSSFFLLIFTSTSNIIPHTDSGVHRTWLNHLGASAYVKVAAQDNGVPQSYNWGSCWKVEARKFVGILRWFHEQQSVQRWRWKVSVTVRFQLLYHFSHGINICTCIWYLLSISWNITFSILLMISRVSMARKMCS